jgi:tetratricopeptide (TPR) repeat protein
MAEEKVTTSEPAFKLNAATLTMLLVIIMPLCYVLYANFINKPEPAKLEVPATTGNSAPANAAATQSDLEKALKAVADAPNHANYINLSLAYYRTGAYEDCVKAAQKALEYNQKSDGAYNNIAAAYGALGKYTEEIEACNKALEINPNNQLAKNNKAWAEGEKAKQK